MSASTTFNDTVIAEFRATGGRVGSAGTATAWSRSTPPVPAQDANRPVPAASHDPPPPDLPAPAHERLGPPVGPNRNERLARVAER